jgi:quercetin dioxygenase-like cupin family protein
MLPAVHDVTAQQTVDLMRIAFAYRLEEANTGGRLAVLEVTVPPQTLIKPHQHSKEDEFSLILSGRVGARVGAETYEQSMPAPRSSSRATSRTPCGT